MKKLKNMLTIFLLFITYAFVINILQIPNKMVIFKNQELNIKTMWGISIKNSDVISSSLDNSSTLTSTEILESTKYLSESTNLEECATGKTSNYQMYLFGKIPLKEIEVNVVETTEVIPLGKVIGLKLYTNGVLVVGKSEVENSENELVRPYESTSIKEGDTIVKVNDIKINSIAELKKAVNSVKDNLMSITILDNSGNEHISSITPAKITETDYKLGLWVKDAATGVGTITYYNPTTMEFAALGHGIADSDTGTLININSGDLVESKVLEIKKGEEGIPGEIRGTIANGKTIGIVKENTQFGIFGELTNLSSLNINPSNKMKVAQRSEISLGKAQILCSLDGETSNLYDIEIEKIYLQNTTDNKSMLIKITDETLLSQTGGIIRGLSGAPLIQNGKFIGAVTNVLISNPQIGYAIFADMMF